MTVRVDTEGALATVTLDRPERMNAMTQEMREALSEVFESINQQPAVRAVLLTGAGGNFCAGADTGHLAEKTPPEVRREVQRGGHRSVKAIFRCEKPVVAVVQGNAVGIGACYALAADLIVAAADARFSFAQLRMGLVAGGGAIWMLVPRVGMGRARQLIYRSRRIDAAAALDMGLVDYVEPVAGVAAAGRALATELAAGPTFAMALSKRLFAASLSSGFEEFLELELMAQSQVQQSADYLEALQATAEKRKPNFTGS